MTTTNGAEAASAAPAVPPQNLDAEESVIGAMLVSPNAITAVADIIRPSDFYRGSHGKVFQTALDIDASGEPVDAITLANALEARGLLDEVGGKVRIHELAALVPVHSNAAHYAGIVKEMSQLRSLISAGQDITRLGWERPGETQHLLSQAESILAEAISTNQSGDLTQASEGFAPALERIKLAVETGQPIFGLKSGFPDLDATTTGFYPSELVCVAARPGFGKSVFGANIAQNVTETTIPAAFFSLEMSKLQLQYRLLARLTGIDSRLIRTGKLSSDEYDKVVRADKHLSQLPLYIEDSGVVTATEIRARARRMKKKVGIGLLVVDYLQLMVSESGYQQKNDQVAAISRSLKLLAKELEIPVIMISQLNRNTESREDKRPTLADLRDSGAVEQDSDIVIFIYRESMYKKVDDATACDAEIIVAKNRSGEIGTVKLLFHGKRQAFLSPAKE